MDLTCIHVSRQYLKNGSVRRQYLEGKDGGSVSIACMHVSGQILVVSGTTRTLICK